MSRSLSAYARQFLEMMQKPDVEHIDGLSPAISIEQKTTSRNPRSTVATVTEIYDYMRLLWARVGVPYSPATGLPISAQTVSQMVDRVMALPEGSRHYLLAPVVRGRKGEYRKELAEWQKAGFTRVRIDGEFYDIDEAPALDKKYKHDLEVVVDRIVIREGIEPRLADSFETALKLADGLAYLDPADAPTRTPRAGERTGVASGARTQAEERAGRSPPTPPTAASPSPRNSPARSPASPSPRSSRGCSASTPRKAPARPATASARNCCSTKTSSSPTTRSRSPRARSCRGPSRSRPRPYYMQVLSSLARAYDFELTDPVGPAARGSAAASSSTAPGASRSRCASSTAASSYEVNKPFEGVIGNLNRRMLPTESAWMREELSRYQSSHPCETCGGARLRPEPLSVKIAGEDISQSARRSVHDALDLVLDPRRKARPAAARDRPRDPQGNQRAPRLPRQCRARLPQPRPHQRHALRRREPAHPPRQPDRLRPLGRPLRPRRAVDRPPPEGQ